MSETTVPYSAVTARKRAFWFGFVCFVLAYFMTAFAVGFDPFAPLWTHVVVWSLVGLLYLGGGVAMSSWMSGRGMRWIVRTKPGGRLQKLTRWIAFPVVLFCLLAVALPKMETTLAPMASDTPTQSSPLILLAMVPLLMLGVFLSFGLLNGAEPLSTRQKQWRLRLTCLSMPVFILCAYAMFLIGFV